MKFLRIKKREGGTKILGGHGEWTIWRLGGKRIERNQDSDKTVHRIVRI